MKCTVLLDKTREEEIVIYAHEKTKLIDEIEQLALGGKTQITVYCKDEILKLHVEDVYCFTSDNGKVYAVCEDNKFLLKTRLYIIEQILGDNFIKINQSSIANMKKIQKFDASISGTLKVIFKNGYSDYVSRRNLKSVKERLGL